jgi:hypothetical protein
MERFNFRMWRSKNSIRLKFEIALENLGGGGGSGGSSGVNDG